MTRSIAWRRTAASGLVNAPLANSPGVDLRGHAMAASPLRVERLPHLVDGRCRRVEREVQVHDGQVADLPGQVDGLEGRHGWAVAVGRVAVDELAEVPDTGAEQAAIEYLFGLTRHTETVRLPQRHVNAQPETRRAQGAHWSAAARRSRTVRALALSTRRTTPRSSAIPRIASMFGFPA